MKVQQRTLGSMRPLVQPCPTPPEQRPGSWAYRSTDAEVPVRFRHSGPVAPRMAEVVDGGRPVDGDLDTTVLGQTTGPTSHPILHRLRSGSSGWIPRRRSYSRRCCSELAVSDTRASPLLLPIGADGLSALGFGLAQRRRGATKALMELLDAFDRRHGAVKI